MAINPKFVVRVFGAALLAASVVGCGLFNNDSKQSVTHIDVGGGADGGSDASDTGSIPIIDVPPSEDGGGLLPPDATPACGRVAPKTNGYYPVPGDVEKRKPCSKVCQDVCLSCDGKFKSALGAGIAYEAEFGPDATLTSEGGTCDKQPSKSQTDPTTQSTFQLSRYVCYCKP